MIKRISIIFAFCVLAGISNVSASNAFTSTSGDCSMACEAYYDGHFTKTGYSVTVYTESGHCKGAYAIYLHNGYQYIRFCNTWICIQGRNRFCYSGNWYIIR